MFHKVFFFWIFGHFFNFFLDFCPATTFVVFLCFFRFFNIDTPDKALKINYLCSQNTSFRPSTDPQNWWLNFLED